jgi:hypothetical protein
MRASMDRNPAAERWILMQCRPGMAHACGAADASVLLLRPSYEPRTPERSILYRTVQAHLARRYRSR